MQIKGSELFKGMRTFSLRERIRNEIKRENHANLGTWWFKPKSAWMSRNGLQ
jgi:hypothetical protein